MEDLIKNGQYNIGYICTTLQCDKGMGDKVALRWIPGNGEASNYTFSQLDRLSNQFANVVQSLGLAAGDGIFLFLPKSPDQIIALLGTLKAQCVSCVVFPNFGEEGLLDRLADSGAKVIVTRKSMVRKVLRIRDRVPALLHILLLDDEDSPGQGTLGYQALMDAAPEHFQTLPTGFDCPSLLHYTSGSTGKPKGVLHRHGSILSQHGTTRDVLGLQEEDIYWCTADTGWVTGTSYGIIGPWSLGITQVHYGGPFDAQEWIALLAREAVTVWYTAPTALRMLMQADDAVITGPSLSVRAVFCVGEPLNPEINLWSRRLLKLEVHDTWFQTETGAIMISNQPGREVRPGSMGQPVAGVDAAILMDDGLPAAPGEQGNLCLKPGWSSMFLTYLNHDEVYQQKFQNGYYYTGDTARCDADGYYWFLGRSDDIINTAGHLVSPFEVESAILEIEEVAESGVIGAPDDLLFEKVVAYVHLHTRFQPSDALELKIRLHVANRVSTIASPREVIFCAGVAKNKSGKILRRVLKARYRGDDPGDISTLEA